MFTGIVSHVSSVLSTQERDHVLELKLSRPADWKNIHPGDSIAVNGVCLTLEKADSSSITFALGRDTLETTGWTIKKLENQKMNLEPALKVGDPIGGHWVTGHVDGLAVVESAVLYGENQFLTIALPEKFQSFLLKKGFIALNGVSLTVQEVLKTGQARLGIVPETLKRTNLSQIKDKDKVTFEICYFTRILRHFSKKAQENSN